MHLIRKLKRMGGLLANGGFKAVKDKIFYEIESRMTYSRLLRKYSKFVAENTCAELPARGGGA